PGGAENALKSSSLYCQENELNKFLLLDGDKSKPKNNPDNFTVKQSDDLVFLKAKLMESTGVDFSSMNFKIDGNKNGGNEIQQKEIIISYLNYHYKNVEFLPRETPEEFLWDENTAKGLILLIHNKKINFHGTY